VLKRNFILLSFDFDLLFFAGDFDLDHSTLIYFDLICMLCDFDVNQQFSDHPDRGRNHYILV